MPSAAAGLYCMQSDTKETLVGQRSLSDPRKPCCDSTSECRVCLTNTRVLHDYSIRMKGVSKRSREVARSVDRLSTKGADHVADRVKTPTTNTTKALNVERSTGRYCNSPEQQAITFSVPGRLSVV